MTEGPGCQQQFPGSKVHGSNMGPSEADRTQVGPMLAPWTLLSGLCWSNFDVITVSHKKVKISSHLNFRMYVKVDTLQCWKCKQFLHQINEVLVRFPKMCILCGLMMWHFPKTTKKCCSMTKGLSLTEGRPCYQGNYCLAPSLSHTHTSVCRCSRVWRP